jgi:hypothetical protein
VTDVFEQYPPACWRPDGASEPIFFPVESIDEEGGNRIVRHRRPHRDGARLEDTGSNETVWTMLAPFNTSGKDGVRNGVPLYPTVLRQLVKSFRVHATGTLVVPTIGRVRARAERYKRRESNEERDHAVLELVFVEDNEESLDRAALNPPGVVSTLRKLSEQTTFTAERTGPWNADTLTLTEFASEIEGLLLAPGRASADLGAIVRSHRNQVQRMQDAAMTLALQTGGLFAEPRGSESQRQFRTMLDREALAEVERTSSRPRVRPYVVDVERTSIVEIAAKLNQDVGELLDLNAARLADPFDIDRGTVLRVFEQAA